MAAIPQTQTAWLQVARGQPKAVLQRKDDVPVPKLEASDDILVQVVAASLNPVGYKMMPVLPSLMRKFPSVPEYDLAGTVVASNSSSFKPGDEVFGIIPADLNFKTGHGALAQYTIVKEINLAHKPKTLSWEEASGMTLTGVTALEGLTRGKLQKGERIFINGGSSSVGRMAIQIAKIMGAHVVTSCSGSSADGVKALGADEIIDYTKVDLPQHLASKFNTSTSQFQVVLDCIGSQALYHKSAFFLASGRKFMTVGSDLKAGFLGLGILKYGYDIASNLLWPQWLGGTPRTWEFFLLKVQPGDLKKLSDWAANNGLKPSIDSVWGFDREGVFGAFDRLASKKVKGKVVVLVAK